MLNVLIVDDSLIIRKNLKSLFKELKYNVVAEASTGQEALDCYDKYMPDLVTMDITMPDMDGITAVKLLNKKYAHTNIIMITSHGQENMVREAIKNGAKGYILKPIVKEKLKQSIDKLFCLLDDDDELLDDDLLD